MIVRKSGDKNKIRVVSYLINLKKAKVFKK